MTSRRNCFACLVACLVIASTTEGQAVMPGDRVRVVQKQGKQVLVRGVLVRLNADSATVVSESIGANAVTLEQSVAMTDEYRLERSAGKKGRTVLGLGVGLLVGATTGALIGYARYEEPDCSQAGLGCFDFGSGLDAIGGALVGGAVGMVLGGVVGAKRKHEIWRPVSSSPVRLGILPTARKGLVLRAHASF